VKNLYSKFLNAFSLTAFFLSGTTAFAQSAPVTVLVPFSAGGTVDIVARVVGQQLTKDHGYSVVVDNRAGAGGAIAAGIAAKAKPNGQTMLAHHQGIVYNAFLVSNLPYDIQRDFIPLATVGATPNALVVPVNSKIKSMADFIAEAKANPGKLNYGSAGQGSNAHLAMELLQAAAGIKLTHVPYKGMPPALTDVASGQIDAVLTTIPAAMTHIQGGRVRAIATSGLKRSNALPDVPTIDEIGVKGFEYQPWYGFFLPAGTPAATVEMLSKSIVDAVNKPEVSAKFLSEGLDVRPLGHVQFAESMRNDIKKWGTIIKSLGIKP
jgi:tripartite-type tricarboxylate transporter receptor subunit TctC